MQLRALVAFLCARTAQGNSLPQHAMAPKIDFCL